MEAFLIAATQEGMLLAEQNEQGWYEARRGLGDQHATSVIAREGVILAGTRQGVFRSDDLGRSWRRASRGLTHPHVRWLAYHPQISDWELAGTEPAGIFISKDGGENWHACPEVFELRDQYGWRLPYSPEAGCVRGFAILGARAYAAVEDGGVLLSDDRGASWRLAPGSRGASDHNPRQGYVHSDVHSIHVHPSSPNLVLAPTGGGFYRSNDGGEIWEAIYRSCYCRAAWLDPQDTQHMLLGPADGVDRNGRIEETRDGGQSWQSASQGLPVPWRDSMVERFSQYGHTIFAMLSNGELWAAPLEELRWKRILAQAPGIKAVTVMQI
jgi:photosystem II stability/assembly factor-like uncharacterized protein